MSEKPSNVKSTDSRIDLHIEATGSRIRKAYILACARHGAQRIMRPIGQVNVVIVTDHKMAQLHREYMNLRGTTDVLTFDLTGDKGNRLDADIYISLNRAKSQAKEQGVTLNEELARLAVHGVLHLAGFRDKSLTQKRQMRWMEEQSLAAAGRPNAP